MKTFDEKFRGDSVELTDANDILQNVRDAVRDVDRLPVGGSSDVPFVRSNETLKIGEFLDDAETHPPGSLSAFFQRLHVRRQAEPLLLLSLYSPDFA
jgi:hypothetical protein